MNVIKTRFAPSPTGFLHIGVARTALFAWAFAKKHHGEFILRIEDTDFERSSEEAIENIIKSMQWLGLDIDKGPFFQTKRFNRYQEIAQKLLDSEHAYYCYCSKERLDQMREEQMRQGLKPKYDQYCLNHKHSVLGVNPVIRFKNPQHGSVAWHDLIKGKIEIDNSELDDLVIVRSDGTPTYNFCVVVDDFDMEITHVIRGDDHVNNTPRQINILHALNATIPFYAHIPMILNEDGKKMSKRTDAVSVMQYKDMGILPEALLNYLARLCFAHGDDEIFSQKQFIQWFDLNHISKSSARFDFNKLLWVNEQHIKQKDSKYLASLVRKHLHQQDIAHSGLNLPHIIELVKSRVNTINDLITQCTYFYHPLPINEEDERKYFSANTNQILAKFATEINQIDTWHIDNITLLIKNFCDKNSIKMPQLGMPLRLKLCGTTQTPSLDAVLFTLGKEVIIKRLSDNLLVNDTVAI